MAWIWRLHILVGRVLPKWAVLKNTCDQVAHVSPFIIFSPKWKVLRPNFLYFFRTIYGPREEKKSVKLSGKSGNSSYSKSNLYRPKTHDFNKSDRKTALGYFVGQFRAVELESRLKTRIPHRVHENFRQSCTELHYVLPLSLLWFLWSSQASLPDPSDTRAAWALSWWHTTAV